MEYPKINLRKKFTPKNIRIKMYFIRRILDNKIFKPKILGISKNNNI